MPGEASAVPRESDRGEAPGGRFHRVGVDGAGEDRRPHAPGLCHAGGERVVTGGGDECLGVRRQVIGAVLEDAALDARPVQRRRPHRRLPEPVDEGERVAEGRLHPVGVAQTGRDDHEFAQRQQHVQVGFDAAHPALERVPGGSERREVVVATREFYRDGRGDHVVARREHAAVGGRGGERATRLGDLLALHGDPRVPQQQARTPAAAVRGVGEGVGDHRVGEVQVPDPDRGGRGDDGRKLGRR